ncbi:MAG: nuclear transport factor 2 family protein [Microcoleus vaginatus WJT46-NPBG5]|nr:nuclear transport factor 2 family protein [Microcoleus vaginatus WJT46-NPBG5]
MANICLSCCGEIGKILIPKAVGYIHNIAEGLEKLCRVVQQRLVPAVCGIFVATIHLITLDSINDQGKGERVMYLSGYGKAMLAGLALSLCLVGPVSAKEAIPNFTAQATQQTQKITESQIRNILEQMKVATKNRNADTITKFMSPKIAIEVTLQAATGSQTLRLSREEYRGYLEQGFQRMQNYNGSYSNLKVQVSPDGKTATATFNANEEITFQGQKIRSNSAETIRFELIQGKILATSLKAVSRIQ